MKKIAQESQTGGPLGFYRLPKMRELLGLSNTTIWELSRRDPNFPKPVKLTRQCTAWRADEVKAWIDSRPRAALHGDSEECVEQ